MKRTALMVLLLATLFAGRLPAAEKKLAKIRVGYGTPAATQVAPRAIRELKIFERNGLDAEFLLASSTLVAQAFLAGEIPIALMTGGLAAAPFLQGSDIVMLAGVINTIPYHFMTRPGIDKPRDLKGKVVGVSRIGSGSDRGLRFSLVKLGLNPDRDVTILQVGGENERLAALLAGKVEGTVITPPLTSKARALGMRTLADLGEQGIAYQHTGIVTSREFIRRNEPLIRAFMKSLVEGIHMMKTHKAETLPVIKKLLLEEDPALIEEAYDVYVLRYLARKPYPNVEGVRSVLEELSSRNPKAKTADISAFFETRFIKELDDSGYIDALYR